MILRPFRSWDGEGITIGQRHYFTLLANSDGEFIYEPRGLTTDYCVEFLTEPRDKAINVWYSFGYDVTKILQNIPLTGTLSLQRLWSKNALWYNHAFYKYIPRKFFDVMHGPHRFRSTDAFSFFQCSFIKALEDWGIDASAIVKGKASREDFATWSFEEIYAYNYAELQLLLELMERLRHSLLGAELVPHSWHGPGAIASVWFSKHKARQYFGVWDSDVDLILRTAYFGGRIDCRIVGETLAYNNDIESAYPAALCYCPDLAEATITHVHKPHDIQPFSVYHVKWDVGRSTLWPPLPWRSQHGTILWPTIGEGWYWGVELIPAMQLFPRDIIVLEGFVFHVAQGDGPLAEHIRKDFALRKELKKKNDPAHKAIKLGLNSLYGKLCQHVTQPGKVPKWRNVAWAGFITAWTRSRLSSLFVTELEPEDVIAFCTDGVFTRKPIHTPGGLGKFICEHDITQCLFIAPGIYSIHDKKVTLPKQKARGMPTDINQGYVLRSWGCTTKLNTPGKDSDRMLYNKFVGIGVALHQDLRIGDFIVEERKVENVSIVGTTKRIPQHPIPNTWRTLPLFVRERPEDCISYPYLPQLTRKSEDDSNEE